MFFLPYLTEAKNLKLPSGKYCIERSESKFSLSANLGRKI
jgi:hypothetical protein